MESRRQTTHENRKQANLVSESIITHTEESEKQRRRKAGRRKGRTSGNPEIRKAEKQKNDKTNSTFVMEDMKDKFMESFMISEQNLVSPELT